jgi:hypothetical protein
MALRLNRSGSGSAATANEPFMIAPEKQYSANRINTTAKAKKVLVLSLRLIDGRSELGLRWLELSRVEVAKPDGGPIGFAALNHIPVAKPRRTQHV